MTGALLNIAGFVSVTAFAGFNIIVAYDRKNSLGAIETAGLSYLFGIGAISIELFLFGLLGLRFTTLYVLVPWVILSIVNIPRFRNMVIARHAVPKQSKKEIASSHRTKSGMLLAMTAVLLIFVVSYAFFMALARPVESYDAVAIWSLKAKALYFAHTIPPDFFTMMGTKFHGAHPDYPLLLPLSEAWFYTFINNFNDLLVKALFPMNFLAFLAVFYIFLKKAISNRTLALLFTFLLASVRQFSNYATNGYADLQMAIYGSLTFLALYLWAKEKKPAYLWTAFFSSLFAMWTKNEGAVILLGFIAVSALNAFTNVVKKKAPPASYRNAIFAAIILIALFISWSLFKSSMNIQNDVVNAETLNRYSLSGLFKRLFAILYEYQRQAFGIKYWNLSWILFIFLVLLRFKKIFSGEDRYITIPIFFILSCYTAIYFITPQDIVWQLRTTASRLLVHILPLAIFYIAMRVDEVCVKER